MRLRILTDLFRQKFVRKTLKYTKYSCGFPPFPDEKSLVRLSCRFVRYCLRNRSVIVMYSNDFHYARDLLWNTAMELASDSSIINQIAKKFLTCRSLDELTALGVHYLSNPIVILDNRYNILSHSGMDGIEDFVEDFVAINEQSPVMALQDLSGIIPYRENQANSLQFPVWKHVLLRNAQLVGYLLIIASVRTFSESDKTAIDTLSTFATAQVLSEHSVSRRSEVVLSDMLRSLLNDTVINEQHFIEVFTQNKWDPDGHIYIAIIHARNRSSIKSITVQDLDNMLHSYFSKVLTVAQDNALIAMIQSGKIMLTNSPDHFYFVDIAEQLQLEIAISNTLPTIFDCKTGVIQAQKALSLGRMLPHENSVFLYQTYVFYHMLEHTRYSIDIQNACFPPLLELVDYDNKNNGELLPTLIAYIRVTHNKTALSKLLYVHYKTITYRLNRVEQIMNVNLSDEETCFKLHCSLKLLEYQEHIKTI